MKLFGININSTIITQIYAGAFPVQWRTVLRRTNTTAAADANTPAVSDDAGARSRHNRPGRMKGPSCRADHWDYGKSIKATENTNSFNPACSTNAIVIHDSDSELSVSADDEGAGASGSTSNKSSRCGQARAAQVDASDQTPDLVCGDTVLPVSVHRVLGTSAMAPVVSASSVVPNLPVLHSKVLVAPALIYATPVDSIELPPIQTPLIGRAQGAIDTGAVSQVCAPPTLSSAATSSSAGRIAASRLPDTSYRSLIFEARYGPLSEPSATTEPCENTLFSSRGTPTISADQSSPSSVRATAPSAYSHPSVPSVSVSRAPEFRAIASGTSGQYAACHLLPASSVSAAATALNGISGTMSRPITKYPGRPAPLVATLSSSSSGRSVSRHQASSRSASQRTVATPVHLQEGINSVAKDPGLSLASVITPAATPDPTPAPGSIPGQDPGLAHAEWAADLSPCKWCSSVTESKACEDTLETDIMLHMKKRVRRYTKLLDFLAKSRGILRNSERRVFMHRIRVQEWKGFWRDYLAPHPDTHELHTKHTLWSIKFFSQFCQQYLRNDCAFKDCLDLIDAVLLERNTMLSNAGKMRETEVKNGQFVQAIEMYCRWKEELEVSGRDGLMNFAFLN